MSEYKTECHKLMHENLEHLAVIEYILIEKSNLSLALRVILIRKRTEEFYEIITKYRNFWISSAKKALESSSDRQKFLHCIKQQNIEKLQLEKARDTFSKVIEKYKPLWQNNFETISLLKEDLESKPAIIQQSTKLYGNFYSENTKTIKLGAMDYSFDAEGFELDIYKLLKAVTVDYYKNPETRVYYTPEIEQKKKPKKELIIAKFHEDIVVANNSDLVNNLKSFYDHENFHKEEEEESSESKADQSIENKAAESEKDYSEYEESESEDPNLIQRLSYTQK